MDTRQNNSGMTNLPYFGQKLSNFLDSRLRGNDLQKNIVATGADCIPRLLYHRRVGVLMVLKRFGWLDIVLIVFLTAGIIYSVPLLTNLQPSVVTVYRGATIIAEYPLSANKTFSVDGIEGKVTISIKNCSALVTESSCRNQLCVRSGAIKLIHGQIICAPNHILVLINSKNKNQSGIDAITR